MYKAFDGKTQFKKHWLDIIYRKVTFLTEGKSKYIEVARRLAVKQEKKAKADKKAKALLEKRKKELETLIGVVPANASKTKKK
jgi:hypothetical protein